MNRQATADDTQDLATIQRQVGEWDREHFPDAPLEVARLAIRGALIHYEMDRAVYLNRISPENATRLEDAAATVLIAILGDLERLPGPSHAVEISPENLTGWRPLDFAAALARRPAAVRGES